MQKQLVVDVYFYLKFWPKTGASPFKNADFQKFQSIFARILSCNNGNTNRKKFN